MDAVKFIQERNRQWIMHDDEFGLTCECGVCHIETMGDGKYCPNCGAQMNGGAADAHN